MSKARKASMSVGISLKSVSIQKRRLRKAKSYAKRRATRGERFAKEEIFKDSFWLNEWA